MTKRTLLLIGAFVVAALTSEAQVTVSWGNDAELRAFTNSAGDLLSVGSALRLGTFASGTDFSTTDYSTLNSHFTEYGVSVIGDGGYGIPGYFVAGVTADAPISTKLFIWSFNSTVASTSTEWGIFSSSGTTWTTGSSAPGTLAMDIYQADFANFGTLNTSFAMTSAVPEPATYAAILGFVTLGVVGFRRFRRR